MNIIMSICTTVAAIITNMHMMIAAVDIITNTRTVTAGVGMSTTIIMRRVISRRCVGKKRCSQGCSRL